MFQHTVNDNPAPAVEGDFASANPRSAVVAPEAGFVAGAAGVTVGQFAWVQADGVTVLNTDSGSGLVPDGFVHRDQQAIITVFLAESSNLIPFGFPVTLMRTGDYFDKVTVAPATRGLKAFASIANGTMQPGVAAAVIPGYIETPFTIDRAAAVGELTAITY